MLFQFCFLSNIDNMGATVDLNVLNFITRGADGEQPEFVMEVTDKTRADVKVRKFQTFNHHYTSCKEKDDDHFTNILLGWHTD